jgi:putative membrane protein
MIRSYNDHAANERTFLAWLRTGLSAITLGIVVKKGSLLTLIAGASVPGLSGSQPDDLSNLVGPALVGIGIATMAVAAIRFVRTAVRIHDQSEYSAGIVGLASALLHPWRMNSGAVEAALAKDHPASSGKRDSVLRKAKRLNLRLVGGADDRRFGS